MSHNNEKIWKEPATPFTASAGMTPFGLYDDDPQFQSDAPKISTWVAHRLGYPIQNIELTDLNIYACFEEAVSEYGAQVNQFNIRNNMDLMSGQPLSGSSSDTSITQKLVEGTNLQTVIELSDSYGTYANVGGRTDIKRGYIKLSRGQQIYDLNDEDVFPQESGSVIRVTRVFYEETPAISRFFDPMASTGVGTLNTIDAFGFGGFSPSTQFVLMPLYEDLLRMQHIEFNDMIRKSAHSFNIVNNKLTIFPVPHGNRRLFFEYMLDPDIRKGQVKIIGTEEEQVVSDYSNIPYTNIPYKKINDVGKQWIRKYTLALAKELLGAIREKYSTIPIPDSEISLDGASLRQEAQTEKDQLLEQLRENLEEISRRNRMELKNQEAEFQQDMLRRIPTLIYIG